MGARWTVGIAHLALFFALTLRPSNVSAAGAPEGCDQVLPGCGICYPGGYDDNTVGEVQGTILDVQAPAQGPVRLVVAGEREQWVVLAAPLGLLESMALHLAPGAAVTVRGSKNLGADGRLYLVAREIRAAGGKPGVVLRDCRGTPLWSGGYRGGRNPLPESADCRSQGLNGWRR